MYKYIISMLALSAISFIVFRDKKPVAANAEIIINAPIENIWNTQTNLSAWQKWNSNIQSMQVDGDIGIGTKFIWEAGGVTIKSEITDYQPKSRMAWRGKSFGIEAYHIWQFTETETGIRVYTEEIFTGFLAWLLPGMMRRQLEKALRHGVVALKQTSEQGRLSNG